MDIDLSGTPNVGINAILVRPTGQLA
jgi:hypothetical protein